MYEKTNGSIIIISHQERILNIADRIIVIADGKIADDGKGKDLLPHLLNTQSATGTCTILKNKVEMAMIKDAEIIILPTFLHFAP